MRPSDPKPALLPGDRGTFLDILLLAVIYVAAARIGLLFEPVGGYASLVWAPSGIALVALALHGLPLWPGVFIGAAIANMLGGASLAPSLAIGMGNTLGAVAGVAALRRVGTDLELHDTRSALAVVGVAAMAAAITASIGTVAVSTLGRVATPPFEIWRAWWLGDAIGNVLVAPVVLVWDTRQPHAVRAPRRLEFVAVLLVNAGIAGVVFSRGPSVELFPSPYLLFPALTWAAVRFGARGAVSAVALAAGVAIFGSINGRGPFARGDIQLSLLGLQAFVGITAATFLVLGAAVAERRIAAEQAQRAREEAEEANRAKAEFLAVMSHELRTPLNAISGFVELLLMGTQGSITDTQRRSLERIQRNQMHLLALINDLLAFTRLEAGRVKLQITQIGVNDMFDQVEPLIQPELRRKDLVFTRLSVGPGTSVRADPDKLAQILVNLLTNAAKYTETGGTVELGASAANGRVRMWVRDSGIGIPADQLEKVFQPFYQVDRGRTRRYHGVGLGLTIARDLARAMDGDVTIESQPGLGTTVTVELPHD